MENDLIIKIKSELQQAKEHFEYVDLNLRQSERISGLDILLLYKIYELDEKITRLEKQIMTPLIHKETE